VTDFRQFHIQQKTVNEKTVKRTFHHRQKAESGVSFFYILIMQVYHITLTKEKNTMAHKRNSVEVPELEKLLAGKKKKYVRYEEGAVLYSMGKNSFRQVAQDAHAVVRLKRIALVNVEVLDEYLESFRE
jgi:hypothetical protein